MVLCTVQMGVMVLRVVYIWRQKGPHILLESAIRKIVLKS